MNIELSQINAVNTGDIEALDAVIAWNITAGIAPELVKGKDVEVSRTLILECYAKTLHEVRAARGVKFVAQS